MPVTKGTFWPITILASSLSRVSRLGVDSTLPSPLFSRNWARNPSTYCPLILLPMPKLKPLPGSTEPRVLAPAALELVPSRPTVPPTLPSRPCHWTPNWATLLALTSTIRLSTSTWARRPSSRSMTSRNCRYCGSGAEMISELVAGSAWICPPVEGWALLPKLLDTPLPKVLVVPVVVLPVALLGVPRLLLDRGLPVLPVSEPVLLAPPLAATRAARKVVASLVASAFFR